ncbi:hypothetical protein [Deinococcus cellulosilyticus]|uniref:Uncharacterized protein n=1 Tax=Deinococcus cellulosilyticus (strain DSM 18568 / NBRC 106333 / KACC 11606 / 5516J-15) TaxID=1223518 RepID=A0A511N0Y3_DEIC1|nr:hypothetical protein [Deinococcus cellulosilyticus]GEM46514.1 hypothetical protein DC3_21490 [Deinococcus cellulosilyticus NBRC 106333 = KACC 11606]
MGYGAHLTVINNSTRDIQLFIEGIECMYDNNEYGSNLSIFNGAQVAAGQAFPAPGGQFIEAVASGRCFFTTSTFQLGVGGVGSVTFADASQSWSVSENTNPGTLLVSIQNGEQATITVVYEG